MTDKKHSIPLCELARELRPFGVALTYCQLSRRAMSAVFPVVRENNRVFAVGQPADIARLIQCDERKRAGKAA